MRYSLALSLVVAASVCAHGKDPKPVSTATVTDVTLSPEDFAGGRLGPVIDLDGYVPMTPPPVRGGPLLGAGAPGIEMVDLRTGEITRLPADAAQPARSAEDEFTPFEGLLPPGAEDRSVLGSDGRVRVSNTASYPWRTVVQLLVTWPNGSATICSGAIIDEFHVLSAGHCVHSQARGGWASTVRVLPGRDVAELPYGEAWGTLMRSYTGWTQDQNWEHDWALITLDRNVGAWTGWMGRITRSAGDPMYTGTLNAAGYPGDLTVGAMYFDSDSGRTATANKHWYYMDTAGGMSGMPVWAYFTSGNDPAPGRYIATVHAYGNDGSGSNSGTRLNADKFDRLVTWTGDDSPPADYADLVDAGDSYASVSSGAVNVGQTFTVRAGVRNVGTAGSGTFRMSFYASTNNIISSADHFLGSIDASTPSPFFDVRSFQLTRAFPQIPSGVYWIGWVIDSASWVPEFNEGNNTRAFAQVAVSAPPPPPGDSCWAAPLVGQGSHFGATTGATNDWSGSCGASMDSPDVWRRFVADQTGQMVIDTCGSSYDTVLSVHAGCQQGEMVCNDDAFAGSCEGTLQSSIEMPVIAGEEFLVRIAGFAGQTGQFTLNIAIVPDEFACPGDASGDLVVNFTDLNSVLFNYGGAGEGLLGDLNGDGVIGFEDLNVVLVNFGTDCLPD